MEPKYVKARPHDVQLQDGRPRKEGSVVQGCAVALLAWAAFVAGVIAIIWAWNVWS